MLKHDKVESQPMTLNPCSVFTYNPPAGFELLFSPSSARDYLEQHEYQELPNNPGLVRSYGLPENTRLAHRYAVVVSHPSQDYLFVLRDFQYSEFMQKWACLASIIQTYLPWFQGQTMLKKLPG